MAETDTVYGRVTDLKLHEIGIDMPSPEVYRLQYFSGKNIAHAYCHSEKEVRSRLRNILKSDKSGWTRTLTINQAAVLRLGLAGKRELQHIVDTHNYQITCPGAGGSGFSRDN